MNITIDSSLPSERAVPELEQLIDWRGKPEKIRVDIDMKFNNSTTTYLLNPGINENYLKDLISKENVFILK